MQIKKNNEEVLIMMQREFEELTGVIVSNALQGIRNEAERYRYLQWLKDDIMKI